MSIKYTLHGSCKSLQDVPKGAHIEEVNGKSVMGFCEACGKPIFITTKYTQDSEGIMLHDQCCARREE